MPENLIIFAATDFFVAAWAKGTTVYGEETYTLRPMEEAPPMEGDLEWRVV